MTNAIRTEATTADLAIINALDTAISSVKSQHSKYTRVLSVAIRNGNEAIVVAVNSKWRVEYIVWALNTDTGVLHTGDYFDSKEAADKVAIDRTNR